jgi:8-oxo-dGTP pyrophosphatase MutT (NUDIX family)
MPASPAIIGAFTGSGVVRTCEYHDADAFDGLEYRKCRQVYAVCFCGEKMVIGFGGRKQGWGLIGGTVEAPETFEQTLAREIREESNMKVVVYQPIGYQKVTDPRDGSFVYQLRYVCVVQPLGPFVADPAGGVTKIQLIDPAEYRKYFDWGEIGERIVARAMELKGRLSSDRNDRDSSTRFQR